MRDTDTPPPHNNKNVLVINTGALIVKWFITIDCASHYLDFSGLVSDEVGPDVVELIWQCSTFGSPLLVTPPADTPTREPANTIRLLRPKSHWLRQLKVLNPQENTKTKAADTFAKWSRIILLVIFYRGALRPYDELANLIITRKLGAGSMYHTLPGTWHNFSRQWLKPG